MTIITIHGYNSDPSSKKYSDRPDSQQREFANALSPHDTMSFNWFSGVQGNWWHILRAWGNKCPTTYHLAYKILAIKAADEFLARYEGARDLNVFAHSLGSRVVLQAINRNPSMFARVCFINAAERVSVASPILKKAPHIKVLNCRVISDDVLDKAAGYMSPGRGKEAILGQDGDDVLSLYSDNFTQITLDRKEHQVFYKEKYGFDLRGDNPDDYGDHHFSYRHKGNWPLYQAFFHGEL